jgi:disulfide bond formation protein DsbB
MERNLNALLVLIISGILLGGFGVQIFMKETPCPLCWLQRIGMIGVAAGAFLNLQFGIRPAHYGLSLISALMGGTIALRQISLHVCPGFSKFGEPVLGVSLYTWSFFVFACATLYIAGLLFLYDPKQPQHPSLTNNWLCRLAIWALLVVTFGNIVATLLQCGLGPCEDVH